MYRARAAAREAAEAAGATPPPPAGQRQGGGGGRLADAQPMAWEISPPPPALSTPAGSTPDRRSGPGGIAFDITLDEKPASRPGRRSNPDPPPRPPASRGPSASPQPPQRTPQTNPPARARHASPPPATPPLEAAAALTSTVPSELFGANTPLSSKVVTLRRHLESKLGGREAFERVYDYVSREESGEQQSGEREQVLHAMGPQRELLPLVHTLLYLEDSLGDR